MNMTTFCDHQHQVAKIRRESEKRTMELRETWRKRQEAKKNQPPKGA